MLGSPLVALRQALMSIRDVTQAEVWMWRLTDSVLVGAARLRVFYRPGATDVTHNDIVLQAQHLLYDAGVCKDTRGAHCLIQVSYHNATPTSNGVPP